MMNKDLNNRAADKFSQFSNSKAGFVALGIWAFLEPSFWFIAADMLLIMMCFYSPKNFIKYFFVTLVSALLGASFYFMLNLIFFDELSKILLITPFVNHGMITQIENIYAVYGLKGLLFQAFSFMSVKIWVHVAVEKSIPFFLFILLTGISRALRFFLVGVVSSKLGARINGFLREHFILLTILYALAFLSVIVFLETTI